MSPWNSNLTLTLRIVLSLHLIFRVQYRYRFAFGCCLFCNSAHTWHLSAGLLMV